MLEERPTKRLRSSTEGELSDSKEGRSSMTLDDSDSESISCEGVFSRAESLENHIAQLKVAIGRDDVEEAEKILQSLDKIDGFLKALNEPDENDYTLLIHATRQASAPLCRAIMKRGVDINVATTKGYSPLVFAAQRGLTDLVFELLQKGVSMVCANTALIPGAHFGREAIVKLLVKYGADVNHTNAKGTTALMRAAQEGHVSVLNFLLANDADPNTANGEGMTALMLASQRGHRNIVRPLIQSKADVNMRTRQGSTALLLASKRGHKEAVIELVTSGANVFVQDDRQKTAYELAQRRGYHELLQYLTMDSQVKMMQQSLRLERSYTIVLLSALKLRRRAQLRQDLRSLSYTSAMSLALDLPATLLAKVTQYIPMPPLYNRRLAYLNYRSSKDPHGVVVDIMPIFDELLADILAGHAETGASQHYSMTTELSRNCPSTNLLDRLHRDQLFQDQLVLSCRIPIPEQLLSRLKQLGHIQAMLKVYGSNGFVCNRTISDEAVTLLGGLLAWYASCQEN